MEVSVSPQSHKTKLQTPRKSSLSGAKKDLWVAIREGSLVDVESALNVLKKSGGILNLRNPCGLTPLHVAVWRNHIPIVRRLLATGADPDARVRHLLSLLVSLKFKKCHQLYLLLLSICFRMENLVGVVSTELCILGISRWLVY